MPEIISEVQFQQILGCVINSFAPPDVTFWRILKAYIIENPVDDVRRIRTLDEKLFIL